ncbi:MAG: hypothetical protein R3C05_25210 [Pirellulaceae bacterium]
MKYWKHLMLLVMFIAVSGMLAVPAVAQYRYYDYDAYYDDLADDYYSPYGYGDPYDYGFYGSALRRGYGGYPNYGYGYGGYGNWGYGAYGNPYNYGWYGWGW